AAAIEGGLLESFTESAYAGLQAEGTTLFERADELLGFTFNLFDVNKEIMGNLAVDSGVSVASSFGQVAAAQQETVNEIMLESVIKPLAQGEAYYSAIKQAQIVTNDEFEQSVIQQEILRAQLAADLVGTELNPLDYLRSRLKAD
ncbi:unnamed protein product, partial [marine sediment metagenome]